MSTSKYLGDQTVGPSNTAFGGDGKTAHQEVPKAMDESGSVGKQFTGRSSHRIRDTWSMSDSSVQSRARLVARRRKLAARLIRRA
jgi:hypothetical protein